MLVAAVMGRGVFYYLTIGSVVAVLALSANTSFADFPRVCRVLAEDRILPDSFAIRGRRLVYSQGIIVLAVLSGALLVVFEGITDRLIPLFAIGALLAFTMSQAGMVAHWRREGGRQARHSLPINLVGAIATGITAVVVAVAKFSEGAWIVVIVLPLLVASFWRIHVHYGRVAAQVADSSPLDIDAVPAPIVVVAAQSWNKMTHRGLQFAMRLSPDVYALQVKAETAKMKDLTAEWATLVEAPARAAKLTPPKLVVLPSTYRQFFQPLVEFVLELRDRNPRRDIVVVIPDLIVARWYHELLHNHRGAILRALLRLRGGPRVIVVNTPLYLKDSAPASTGYNARGLTMNKRDFLRTSAGAGLGLLLGDTVWARFADLVPERLAEGEDFWTAIRAKYRLKPDYINLESGYYSMQASRCSRPSSRRSAR